MMDQDPASADVSTQRAHNSRMPSDSRLTTLEIKSAFLEKHIDNVIKGDNRSIKYLTMILGFSSVLMAGLFGIISFFSLFNQSQNSDKIDKAVSDARAAVDASKTEIEKVIATYSGERKPSSVSVESYGGHVLNVRGYIEAYQYNGQVSYRPHYDLRVRLKANGNGIARYSGVSVRIEGSFYQL